MVQVAPIIIGSFAVYLSFKNNCTYNNTDASLTGVQVFAFFIPALIQLGAFLTLLRLLLKKTSKFYRLGILILISLIGNFICLFISVRELGFWSDVTCKNRSFYIYNTLWYILVIYVVYRIYLLYYYNSF